MTEPVRLKKLGVQREPGWLYGVDKSGWLERVWMGGGGEKRVEKIADTGIDWEVYYRPYLNKDGDVCAFVMDAVQRDIQRINRNPPTSLPGRYLRSLCSESRWWAVWKYSLTLDSDEMQDWPDVVYVIHVAHLLFFRLMDGGWTRYFRSYGDEHEEMMPFALEALGLDQIAETFAAGLRLHAGSDGIEVADNAGDIFDALVDKDVLAAQIRALDGAMERYVNEHLDELE